MRVLIADDEFLARSSLRSMLGELGLPLELVAEATNGQEMVELVQSCLPDVAFVDIRMPKLDGLEAIKIGRAASPRTQWFILTGFPEFAYAQEAIRLGVAAYLLKPVDPDELRKALLNQIQAHRRSVLARNKQFEHDMAALYYGLSSAASEGSDAELRKSHFVGAILYLDSHLPKCVKAERQLDLRQNLEAAADRILNEKIRIALFVLPGGELATVGAWDAQDPHSRRQLQAHVRMVEQTAWRASDPDLAVTALLTAECSSCQALHQQVAELQRLAPLRAAGGIGGKLELAELGELETQAGCLELCRQIARLCRCHDEKSYLSYMEVVQACGKSLRAVDGSRKKAIADFVRRSMRCQLLPEQSVKVWLRLLEEHGERMLEDPRPSGSGEDAIDQVIALIDQYYMHDIGIGQIAAQLHLTPNYLSTLFHKKTGSTFVAYLTRTRMLRAKELLADPNIQVQQVAEQVGYSSARYFTRLFTRFTGCYPSEYRNRHKPPAL